VHLTCSPDDSQSPSSSNDISCSAILCTAFDLCQCFPNSFEHCCDNWVSSQSVSLVSRPVVFPAYLSCNHCFAVFRSLLLRSSVSAMSTSVLRGTPRPCSVTESQQITLAIYQHAKVLMSLKGNLPGLPSRNHQTFFTTDQMNDRMMSAGRIITSIQCKNYRKYKDSKRLFLKKLSKKPNFLLRRQY